MKRELTVCEQPLRKDGAVPDGDSLPAHFRFEPGTSQYGPRRGVDLGVQKDFGVPIPASGW